MEATVKSNNRAKLVDIAGSDKLLLSNLKKSQRSSFSKTYDDLLEIKKSRNLLSEEQRPLFMSIGLCVSLLLIIVAFNWKSYDAAILDLGEISGDFDEILEVPLSVQPPPPPPQKVEVFTIKTVDDAQIIEEVAVKLDAEATEDMQVDAVIFEDIALGEVVEEAAEEIFQIVEDKPSFPGGLSAFYEYLANNIDYPEGARRLGVTGRVFVQFVVEKDGTPTQVVVVKGIGSGCDEEAIRVIEQSPKWIPGRQRGNAVRVYLTVPIFFKLAE